MLLLASAVLAAPAPEVRPWAFVKPAFAYVANSDQVVTDQDGLTLYGELGLDAAYQPAHLAARVSLTVVPDAQLKDAVVSWSPIPQLRVDAGQHKVPMGVGFLASDSRRQLPRLSPSNAWVTSLDLGVGVTGMLNLGGQNYGQFTSAIYNGEGANRIQNVNERYLLAQRLLITPFGARARPFEGSDGALYLGVGGGWVWNVIGADLTAEEMNHFSGDVQFAKGVLSVQGEFFYGDHRFANPDVDNYTFLGGYGQVGLFVPIGWAARHLELVGRGGYDDPDRTVGGLVGGQIGPATVEVTGGLNLYALADPERFHDFKLQVAYSAFLEQEGETVDQKNSKVSNDTIVAMGVARF